MGLPRPPRRGLLSLRAPRRRPGGPAVERPAPPRPPPGVAAEAGGAVAEAGRARLCPLRPVAPAASSAWGLGALAALRRRSPGAAGAAHIGVELKARLERGELDQPWNEELGLCATQLGRERWYRKSEVDPASHHADLAVAYVAADPYGWPGRGDANRGDADAERSLEERRILGLHTSLLQRERYVGVGFWKLVLKGLWADEPGGYPGPAFETKAEFVRGTRPGNWPLGLEGTEDIRVCDLGGSQLAAHLRAFIWRGNSDGSFKASLIMIFLGVVPFLQSFLAEQIVEGAGVFTSSDVRLGAWLQARPCLFALALGTVELFSHYMSFKFWTTVPKYGVLRQFQSFFGRRCLHVLRTQAGPRHNEPTCVHEDRFRKSPGLCQAVVNYCCEAVVLNLWGKSFDLMRAKASLIASLLLIVYAMVSDEATGGDSGSHWSAFSVNFCRYGWCIFLFMALNAALLSVNVFIRTQQSVDVWGVATKAKINMLSLQQELMCRMMSEGRHRRGLPLDSTDQQLLDAACSDWHDACRIYGNRDFHTWFSSWIVTDVFNSMLSSFSFMLCTLVLLFEIFDGRMRVGTFVMALGSVRSISGAFATTLSYHFSMPEGYVALLYLAQICNMNVPGDDEGNHEKEPGGDRLTSTSLLQYKTQDRASYP
ncbi:unnamed protein product [Prorocentrum cordatum]|uniref:ABC transmembrane type-1 domain-containing protein n=1 Tax=Prorocentrum cordatum TaxID=2364126 RepID=A0ABN9RV49_9DINO|nr:unnamed protein product [Polarella glacialis]